jgi:hypothetical protein
VGGFRASHIHCDNEFKLATDEIKQKYHDLQVNYSNAQEHVPKAEPNNRVIKERVRATFHRLPFNRLPKTMIKVLKMESAKKLNFFVPKGGVSKFYSPRMILHQHNIDYNKHCAFTFGMYVQAEHESTFKNDQHPRTLDCLYLQYVNANQGGHKLFDLRTGAIITLYQSGG